MTSIDARTVPADPISAARLADAGLEYRLLDVADAEASRAFARAVARGFLGDEPAEEAYALTLRSFRERRNIGVYEPGSQLPVATVNSWATPMTVPGGEVPMWAISEVSVAATHRRRGIARALLEGELRAAASAGVPLAGLTVSEATIYSRYGFAPAVPVARMRIDTRKAGGLGGSEPGRIEYVEGEGLAAALAEAHERSRAQRAGQIPGWDVRWERMAGLDPSDSKARGVRGVRYRDAAGVVRGALAYRLEEGKGFRFTLWVWHLAAETDEALRALWAFALNHDLVDEVRADLRPLDDPLAWLVADQRAVEMVVHDHGWLRILDVPAALAARRCRGPLDALLGVRDPLGFAEGAWRLLVDAEGRVTVTASDAAADVILGVEELSAIYAGGVPATQLAAAGRISGSAEAIAALDEAFRTSPAPHLGIWY